LRSKFINILLAPASLFSIFYLAMLIFAVIPERENFNLIFAPFLQETRNYISFSGIMIHVASIICFLFGCFLATLVTRKMVNSNDYYVINHFRVVSLVYLFCIITLLIILMQIYTIGDPLIIIGDLLNSLTDQEGSVDKYFIFYGHSYLTKGGLPGIIKMFNYLPLSALYLVFTYDVINNKMGINKSIKKLMIIIIAISLLRTSIVFDRAFVAIIISSIIIYNFTIKINYADNELLNYRYILLIVLVILLFINVISDKRESLTLIDTLMLYSSLGLSNLSQTMVSNFPYSYGNFTFYVIYSPIKFFWNFITTQQFDLYIFKELTRHSTYVWSEATYLSDYAFMDFGFGSAIFFITFGFLSNYFYIKRRKNLQKYTFAILLSCYIAIITSIIVPIFTGIDWFIAFICGIIAIKVCFKKVIIHNNIL